jgi:hypothetical protein
MEITGVTPYGARKNQFLSIVQEERVFKNQPFQDILSIMHRYFAVTKSSSGQILASQIGIFFACWPTSQSLSFHVLGTSLTASVHVHVVQSPCLEMAVCGNLLAKLHRERA